MTKFHALLIENIVVLVFRIVPVKIVDALQFLVYTVLLLRI